MLEASRPQSVGAAAVQDPVTALELNKGDWSDVREKGQFTSNLSVDSARVSRLAFPASGTQLASSPFAESRVAGAFMAGNPIGYKNAANPVSAAASRKHLKEVALGKYGPFDVLLIPEPESPPLKHLNKLSAKRRRSAQRDIGKCLRRREPFPVFDGSRAALYQVVSGTL